ncbi:MAG: PQQ-binding-like beta-propeller repeat protein [Gemmatimonadales bacterium]
MRAIVAGALCLVNACTSVQREGPAFQERPWPAYLGGPARAGTQPESIGTDPKPIWHVSVGRGITGGPALSEAVLAVAAVDRRVVLLERATGAQIWDHRVSLPIGAGPLIRDDRLFVAEQIEGGSVYALQLLNGHELWRTDAGAVAAPLALEGDALYVATLNGSVLRLAAGRGTVSWHVKLPGAVRAAPLPTPFGLVVATAADSLFLLDAATGSVRARVATRGTVLAAPALADSLVVIGTAAGRIVGVDAATLETRWSQSATDPIVGSVAIAGGRVWALTGRGVLCSLSLAEPRTMQAVPLGLVVRAGPSPVPGGVLVSGVNGELVLVDGTGARRWAARVEPPLVEPAIADGHTIIAVSVRGEVVAFR